MFAMFIRTLLFLYAGLLLAAGPAKIVLIAGRPSHGAGEHEFNAGTILLDQCLRQNSGVQTVIVKNGWPEDEKVFEGAKAVVLYMDGGAGHPLIKLNHLDTMAKLMKNKVGLSCLHYAVEIPKENGGPQLLDWIGGFYERPYSTNPINDVKVMRETPKHPVSNGWNDYSAKDEWYYRIRFTDGDRRLVPILTTMLPKDKPGKENLAWVVQRADGGRGFGFTGGHYHTGWGIEEQRRLVVNAILWTAGVKPPKSGAKVKYAAEDLGKNLDPKPARQPNPNKKK